MPDDTSNVKRPKPGTSYHLHITPAVLVAAMAEASPSDERFDTRSEAEERKSELEEQGCSVTLAPLHVVDPSAPQPSMIPDVTWTRVDPLDVISGVKSLGTISLESRIISYRGQDVPTLLSWAFQELELAEAATSEPDQERHATQAVVHAKTAIDCLFDAYIERDYLAVRLGERPQFSKKLELLKQRLGNQLPWRLIPVVIASPRDAAQHERITPTLEEAGASVEAAKVIVQAMTTASNPLVGPALAGPLLGGSYHDEGGYKIYVLGFPPAFGLFWRGSDDVIRVGAGTASAKNVAEVRFAQLDAFAPAQHLALLRIWDTFSANWNRSEPMVREELKLADLDMPKK